MGYHQASISRQAGQCGNHISHGNRVIGW
jgi:hypothetical protein